MRAGPAGRWMVHALEPALYSALQLPGAAPGHVTLHPVPSAGRVQRRSLSSSNATEYRPSMTGRPDMHAAWVHRSLLIILVAPMNDDERSFALPPCALRQPSTGRRRPSWSSATTSFHLHLPAGWGAPPVLVVNNEIIAPVRRA